MSRIQELSKGEGGEAYERPKGPKNSPERSEMNAIMQTAPIPGQSLVQDPENRLPYEKPPKFTDVQEFIDESFMQLTDPDRLPMILDALRNRLPVEHVAEKYLMTAFTKGQITPDMLLLCIEPIIYMLISLATYAKIDPVLYPQDPMIDSDEDDQTKLYRQASRDLMKDMDDTDGDGRLTVQDIQAPTVAPRSLLARSKKAVEGVSDVPTQ